MRKCTQCGVKATSKDELDLFVKGKHSKYGRFNLCKKCANKKGRTSPTKQKSKVKIRYGITLEEYAEAMSSSSTCEICGTSKDLCYDHDHKTMEFRGVLCRQCNRSIGQLGDTLESLRKVVDYLEKKVDSPKTK